jgi:protein phosphatase
VHYYANTDIGRKRQINQDNLGIGEKSVAEEKGYLLVVCDGMGGHTAGEVASSIGVEAIVEYHRDSADESFHDLLKTAFLRANDRIYQEGQGSMGTTGVAAILKDEHLYLGNVGDSRAYRIRDGHIEQLSRDHSLVAEQVHAGIITPEQARHSSYRNMITRALGYRPEVEVDTFEEKLLPGDIILLSSDGMHGLIEDDEIMQVASKYPPKDAVERLIDMANDRGGTDNITVAIAYVLREDEKFDEQQQGRGEERQSNSPTDPNATIRLPKEEIEPESSPQEGQDQEESGQEDKSKDTDFSCGSPPPPNEPDTPVPPAPNTRFPPWMVAAGGVLALVLLFFGVKGIFGSGGENSTATGIDNGTSTSQPITMTTTIEITTTETSTPTKAPTNTPTLSPSPTDSPTNTPTETPRPTRTVTPSPGGTTPPPLTQTSTAIVDPDSPLDNFSPLTVWPPFWSTQSFTQSYQSVRKAVQAAETISSSQPTATPSIVATALLTTTNTNTDNTRVSTTTSPLEPTQVPLVRPTIRATVVITETNPVSPTQP